MLLQVKGFGSEPKWRTEFSKVNPRKVLQGIPLESPLEKLEYQPALVCTIYTATHLAGTSIHPNNDNVDAQYPCSQFNAVEAHFSVYH